MRNVSSRWGITVLLGGVLSGLWGCADFDQEQDAFCARQPEKCAPQTPTPTPPAPEARAPVITQRSQSAEVIPVEGNITFGVSVQSEGTAPVEFTWTSSQGSFEKIEKTGASSTVSWVPPVCPSPGSRVTVTVVITRAGLSTTQEFSVQADTCPVTMISTKGDHTLALRKDGTVWGWGENSFGQLGDGQFFDRKLPIQVVGLRDIVFISAGSNHSLAVTREGAVWAWGRNESGQLGDVPITYTRQPVLVEGLGEVIAVGAGALKEGNGGYSVALKKDGSVWSWGANSVGQLGTGTTTGRRIPAQVPGLAGVTSVVVGSGSSFALLRNGSVWAWGLNGDGQLGNGTTKNGLTPAPVPNLANVKALAIGETSFQSADPFWSHSHVLALRGDGSLWVWGNNEYGQLGDGTVTNRLSPVGLPSLSGIKAIATGGQHSLALLEDGSVWGWGVNKYGRLGDGSSRNRLSPTRVMNAEGTVALSAGSSHSVSLRRDGSVWAWGDSISGQLGNGAIRAKTSPVAVVGLTSVTAIATGASRSMALRENGGVWLWGEAILDSSNDPSVLPTPVSGLPSEAISIALGETHAVVASRFGGVSAWGFNHEGQIGDGTTINRPSPVSVYSSSGFWFLAPVVSAKSTRSMALKSDGTVWEWGAGRNAPIQVPGLSNVIKISPGNKHALALRRDGTVWAWGSNESGQLGDGTTTTRTTPTQVPGLSGIVDIAGDYSLSFAVGGNGALWAWGNNALGRFGDGSYLSSTSPLLISGLTEVVSVAAASDHCLALRKDGTVWAWGWNYSGQLGDGSLFDRLKPALVPGLMDVAAISAQGQHSLALLKDGTVRAWGLDRSGELGDGLASFSFTPVRALLP